VDPRSCRSPVLPPRWIHARTAQGSQPLAGTHGSLVPAPGWSRGACRDGFGEEIWERRSGSWDVFLLQEIERTKRGGKVKPWVNWDE
jgi:hypothetical protein